MPDGCTENYLQRMKRGCLEEADIDHRGNEGKREMRVLKRRRHV